MPITGRIVLKLFRLKGWKFISQRGSHVKIRKDAITLIIPVHGKRTLGKGLIRALEKQSGEKLL